MKTHEELISLIGNMFTDTYVAGARNDLVSFLDAKAQREELFAAVKDLYEEIADRGIRINDLLHELHRYREEEYQRTHAKLNMAEFYGKKISHVDDRSIYPSAVDNREEWLRKNTTVFDNIPDDADKFSEQDLPFPDVAVAGLGPATTEASAEAEGEAAPAEEVDGANE